MEGPDPSKIPFSSIPPRPRRVESRKKQDFRQRGYMSPTLLELVIALILIIVIWQIGVVLAPIMFTWFRKLGRGVDDAAEIIEEHKRSDQFSQPQSKEHRNGKER